MSKSVLITGAAGFIGSHLAERCLGLGWRVIAVDALTDYYDNGVKRKNVVDASNDPQYVFIQDDLLELALEPIIADVDLVFHLAAQPGVRTSWAEFDRYTRANVDATQRLLHSARDAPLERFVIASSSSIYGDAETLPTAETIVPRPVSPYGVTKVTTEHLGQVYFRNYGVPTVCLRYFTVYGPRQRPDMAFNRLIAAALERRPFQVFGDGEQTRDFTFVADAVSGTVAAALQGVPGTSYNIGGGSARSMNSVFDTLSGLLGEPINVTYLDRQIGDARDTASDITLARRHLGFNPSMSFSEGLRAQLEWQRAGMSVAGPAFR